MKGLNLSSFQFDLERLESDSSDPLAAIDWEARLNPYFSELKDRYGFSTEFRKTYYDFPLKYLSGFTFSELCMLKHSTRISMHSSVGKLFENEPQYEIVRKIESSMWRWGSGQGSWNEVVDAYNNIRNFQLLGLPDFELRLDHTTGYNPRGYTKYSRLFIDGVFALYIYHKDKHVFTLGFSVIPGRKLLIQQAQSAQQKSNRSLYKLPSNRIEFAIDMFSQNFQGYEIYLVSGNSLVKRIEKDYESALANAENYLNTHRSESSSSYYKRVQEDRKAFQEKLAHLGLRRDRIVDFYLNPGKYRLGKKSLTLNELNLRRVLAPASSLKRESKKLVMA